MARISNGSVSSDEAQTPVAALPPSKKPSLVPLAGGVAGALLGRVRAALDRVLYSSFIWRQMLAGPAPDRLLAQPRSFFPKSIVQAQQILEGRYRLVGGEAEASDGSPFFAEAPSEQWLESLHSFEWLRHLEAVGGEPMQAHVRQLLAHWIRTFGQDWSDVAWRPHVTARRLMVWASLGRLILTNSDILFRSRVLWSMARQARHLALTATKAPPGLPRLTAIIGLVQSGMTLPDGEKRLAKGLHLLAEELTTQILADGGHISRNPESVLVVMSDLLALNDAMRQRHIVVPATIRRALDRMAPMVRFLTLGDGRLASFNGGTEGPDGWSALLLTHEESSHRVLTHAPHTGYDGLTGGSTAIVVDVGVPPPPELSAEAHAGTLSFEMSLGRERLIVNCGSPTTRGADWMAATRATAAHSTLTIADSSSGNVLAQHFAVRLLGARLLPGPTHVEVKRNEVENGIWLHMNHDGYVKPFGLFHERELFLSNDGSRLEGHDRVSPRGRKADQPPLPLAVRFHLHPDIRVALNAEGHTAVLTAPSGAAWRFETESADLALGESVYCGAGDALRKTAQLVIASMSSAEPVSLKWTLRRLSDDIPSPF